MYMASIKQEMGCIAWLYAWEFAAPAQQREPSFPVTTDFLLKEKLHYKTRNIYFAALNDFYFSYIFVIQKFCKCKHNWCFNKIHYYNSLLWFTKVLRLYEVFQVNRTLFFSSHGGNSDLKICVYFIAVGLVKILK